MALYMFFLNCDNILHLRLVNKYISSKTSSYCYEKKYFNLYNEDSEIMSDDLLKKIKRLYVNKLEKQCVNINRVNLSVITHLVF